MYDNFKLFLATNLTTSYSDRDYENLFNFFFFKKKEKQVNFVATLFIKT